MRRGAIPRDQNACWAALAAEWDERTEYERVELYLEAPKRHQPQQQSSTAATSRKPATVALASDDPLKKIEPRLYVETLTARSCQPPAGSAARCPTTRRYGELPGAPVALEVFRLRSGWLDHRLGGRTVRHHPLGSGYWDLRDLIVEALHGTSLYPRRTND